MASSDGWPQGVRCIENAVCISTSFELLGVATAERLSGTIFSIKSVINSRHKHESM